MIERPDLFRGQRVWVLERPSFAGTDLIDWSGASASSIQPVGVVRSKKPFLREGILDCANSDFGDMWDVYFTGYGDQVKSMFWARDIFTDHQEALRALTLHALERTA